MPVTTAFFQSINAKRRENEHNRFQQAEAVKKFYDDWDKVTSRFENWTTPDYYKQAEQLLENTKQQKEKQKILEERQKKLAQLLDKEKKIYEQEIQEKQKSKCSRKFIDTETLEKIHNNLKEQQQIKRKLELEAKLYGKWRYGVLDDNLLFESKSDNEVMAKLNWLDKQVDEQLQREKAEEISKQRELQFQQEMNKSQELQKARQQIREKEISEVRCMQECHLQKLKERQKESDELKEKEKNLKENLNELKMELELLEESYAVLSEKVDHADTYKLNKIKIFMRKRSEVFRNNIKLCISVLQRTLEFTDKTKVLNNLKKQLEQQLENENENLSQLEGMYESEAKHTLQRCEELWQQQHTQRYNELKHFLTDICNSINASLDNVMRKIEELWEIRTSHLHAIENSSEKLKLLIQEEENSPRFQKTTDISTQNGAKHAQISSKHQTTKNVIHSQLEESADTPLYAPQHYTYDITGCHEPSEPLHQVDFSSRRNCYESPNNNMAPTCNDMNRMSKSFTNLNLDVWQPNESDLELPKMSSRRSLQVVTPETEAERPRFGRKRVAWN